MQVKQAVSVCQVTETYVDRCRFDLDSGKLVQELRIATAKGDVEIEVWWLRETHLVHKYTSAQLVVHWAIHHPSYCLDYKTS